MWKIIRSSGLGTVSALSKGGTRINESGQLVTAGGRVLVVTASAPDLKAAIQLAYKGTESIEFDGMILRRDIGHRAHRRR